MKPKNKLTIRTNQQLIHKLLSFCFALFCLYLFVLPWQKRHLFNLSQASPFGVFNEWLGLAFYFSDFILIGLFLLFAVALCLELIQGGRKHFLKRWQTSFNRDQNRHLLLLISLFLLIAALSLFLGNLVNFEVGLYRLARLGSALLLFVYILAEIKSRRRLIYTFLTLALGALFQALIGFLQFFSQKSLELKFLGEIDIAPEITNIAKIVIDNSRLIRPVGTLPHANLLALFLFTGFFGLLFVILLLSNKLFHVEQFQPSFNSTKSVKPGLSRLLFHVEQLLITKILKSSWFKITLIACLLFLALVLSLSLSRVIFLCLILSLIVFLIFKLLHSKFKKSRDCTMIPVIASILFFLLLISVLCYPIFLNRAKIADQAGDSAVSNRAELNERALQNIRQSPFFGVSLGNFIPRFLKDDPNLDSWRYQPAHNLFILSAAEIGLPGLIVFLVFLGLILKQLCSTWNKVGSAGKPYLILIISFFLSYLIIANFDHYFWTINQGLMLFWVVLALIISLAKKIEQNCSTWNNFVRSRKFTL